MAGGGIKPRELVIIGGGPAGITAAVYAARKMIDFVLITFDIGGQAAWSGDIENYTGYQFITGADLAAKLRAHADQYKFELREAVTVNRISKEGDNFTVLVSDGQKISARALIIASGKTPRFLGVPGEKEFKNLGVTYCATCDGPLFGGKDVVVVGGGNSALDAALQMVKIAKKTYLVNIADKLTGDPIMGEKLKTFPNIEILNKSRVVEITGERFVKAVKIETDGKPRELPAQGVFIEAGLVPNSGFIDFIEKNKRGEIVIDCGASTSVPGIFAAGDVTDVPDKQIIVAAGDGAKAALAASRFLNTLGN